MVLPPVPPTLRLEQVSLAAPQGTHFLLKNITFTAFPSDRIALVGASGAGKSSLLRLLNRLSEPTHGVIYLEEKPLPTISVLQLRQRVMLVPQEPKLLGMTVRDALSYPLQLRNLPPAIIQERLAYWTQQLRIPSDWLERNELQLSTGQRQWVAIARALVTQPEILLLDEPTASLDVGRSERLLEVLSHCSGTTMIMANHQLNLAEQFCNRVLHLERGELVQDHPVDQMDWPQLQVAFRHQEQQNLSEWS